MKIPCDTIARLSHVLPLPGTEGVDEALASFRLDNGKVIATNRSFMAIEEVESFDGVFYIKAVPELIEQCRTEAQYSSVIEFTPVEMLKYTTATTTLGFKIAENIGVWPDQPTDYDKWHETVVKPCLEPLTDSHGPMSVSTDMLIELAKSSPSGEIVFEEYFDPYNRPTIVRDAKAAHWVGFFRPKMNDGRHHVAATVPRWCQ